MTIKTILVPAQDEQRFRQLLTAARVLARPFGARILALAILPAPYVFATGTPDHPDAVTLDQHRTAMLKATSHMRAIFGEELRNHDLHGEWRLSDAADPALSARTPTTMAVAAAHIADLVIAEQLDPDRRLSQSSSMTESILLASGRPTLLIPRHLPEQLTFDRIVVAWNAARSSTRAVADAIPLLRLSRSVHIVHFTGTDRRGIEDLGSASSLAAALIRHDINATAEELPLSMHEPGAAILASVKANNADMLVMGCYGHRRLHEFIFGGSTRHVLQHMTVPVLMAH
jgi:nucleotide-binding universal stress UspA family protein